jgi:dTDP-glucose pyrophosphorylase
MAGSSRRFKKFGYLKPKWTIEIGGIPMLYYSLKTIKPLMFQSEKIVLILLKSDASHVKTILNRIDISDIEIVLIDNPTDGQAITALEGLRRLTFNPSERLIIWCSDAYVNDAEPMKGLSVQNRLYVSQLPGDHWSFVEIAENHVIRTSEKERISTFASIGLYEFKSIQEFIQLKFTKYGVQKEVYIAPLYNQLISNQSEIYFREINKENYFSFGTPGELIESANRLGLNFSFDNL